MKRYRVLGLVVALQCCAMGFAESAEGSEVSELSEVSEDSEFSELSLPAPKIDVKFWQNRTNLKLKPYRFWDDMNFAGLPLFVAGLAIKSEKDAFRQNYDDPLHTNTRLIPHFHTSIDNYLQYFGPAMTVALKIGGVEGRSSWPRLLATTAIGYGTMAVLVNGIKYTAKERRPDNSSYNSWPSGHTATSFVGATILHKEYGLTRSPWYSVLGYSVATATGVMRVLNNRHWVSDVLSGAGIGILSTELAYALTDVMFKEKGLLRNDKERTDHSPSFFALSVGLGLGRQSLNFTPDDVVDKSILGRDFNIGNIGVDFQTATTIDVEGAYFLNKYVGVGGRLRVRGLRARQWSDLSSYIETDIQKVERNLGDCYMKGSLSLSEPELVTKMQRMRNDVSSIATTRDIEVVSNHLTEFAASAGAYLNLPLGRDFALGAKLLVGRSVVQELAISAHFAGEVKKVDYNMQLDNGKVTQLEITNVASTGQTYDLQWDFLTLGGTNQITYGTGVSCSYHYKSNFVWKLFLDYDFTRRSFNLHYDPSQFAGQALPGTEPLHEALGVRQAPLDYRIRRNMHLFTLGGTFAVAF